MTPLLTTDRLVLRGLEPDEAALLLDFDVRNREFLAPWEPLRTPEYFTEARAAGSIRADADAAQRQVGFRWHLFLPQDPGRIVGSVALSNIVQGVFLSCHMGYRLDAQAQGQGYMTEAVAAVVDHAFGAWGLHRIEANVIPRNRASRRVVTRLGFEEEGLARRYLKIAGVWEDHLHYVRLNPLVE